MQKINLKKKLKFIILILILLIFSIELVLRLLNIEYPIFQKHDEIKGFSLLENSSGTWRREGKGKVRINSDGLRDIEHDLIKPNNSIRIAVLGDSFAEARSVNINETFWFKLKNNLEFCNNFHKNKKIEVINFGVTEYGTTQQYLTLKNNVWKYDPDLVILAFYSGNDISDNVKSLSKKKYRPYFTFNNGSVSVDKTFLETEPYKLLSSFSGKTFINLSQYFRSLQLLREAYVQMYFKRLKKDKKLINDKKSNKFTVYNPGNSTWLEGWLITERIIKMINSEILKNNKEFILVSLSTPIQVHPIKKKLDDFKNKNNINDIFYPDKRLNEFSKKNSIKFIQIAQQMRSIAVKDKVFFHGFENTNLGSGHWNETGHEIASKLISEKICNFY